MASQQSIVDAIIIAASGAGDVSARKMFGEYALYCDDQLFVKPTDAGRHLAGAVEDVPPYEGAKPSLLIPSDRWQDGAWLSNLIRVTTDALPLPKPKKTKRR